MSRAVLCERVATSGNAHVGKLRIRKLVQQANGPRAAVQSFTLTARANTMAVLKEGSLC
jgi:hypothetical protein